MYKSAERFPFREYWELQIMSCHYCDELWPVVLAVDIVVSQ